MNVSQVLQRADARLTPETWTQHPSEDHARGHDWRLCAYLAIDGATTNLLARRASLDLFAQVVSGTVSRAEIFLWNDRAATTLQDVHEAFAAAVEIARQQEQSVREEVPCAG